MRVAATGPLFQKKPSQEWQSCGYGVGLSRVPVNATVLPL